MGLKIICGLALAFAVISTASAGTITESCTLYDGSGNFLSNACVDPNGDKVYYASDISAGFEGGLNGWVVSDSYTLSINVPLNSSSGWPYEFSVDLTEVASASETFTIPGSGTGYLEYFVQGGGPVGTIGGDGITGGKPPSLVAPCGNSLANSLCDIPFTYGVPFTLTMSASFSVEVTQSHFVFIDEEDNSVSGELRGIFPDIVAPEPSSFWLVGSACLSALAFRHRARLRR